MIHIAILGMNHKTAPVEVREQLALVCRDESHLLCMLPSLEFVKELLLVSTCNRVEFLFTCSSLSDAVGEVKELLRIHLSGLPADHFESCLYILNDMDAVRHLFRVASSLDSMVVGEPQILGQIKAAYRQATECRTVGVILNRLLHKSFSVAKRVRSETMIGSLAVSISYAAVELARKIFGELRGKKVLLIGAGEMAELAAEHFLTHGVRDMIVANRTLERALDLAMRFRASTIAFDHILDNLREVDIVLTSTGSPDPIMRYQDVRSRMRQRRNRPLFFIDIAVPRDVEPKVNEIDNVYVYDIDDLKGVVDFNREERQKEAEKAEHLISEETLKFKNWVGTLDVVPTIIALREKAEAIRHNELLRTFSQLPHLSDSDREAIQVLTESIVNKLLHDPIVTLKRKAEKESQQAFVDHTQQLFNLSNGDKPVLSSLPGDEADIDKGPKRILEYTKD